MKKIIKYLKSLVYVGCKRSPNGEHDFSLKEFEAIITDDNNVEIKQETYYLYICEYCNDQYFPPKR